MKKRVTLTLEPEAVRKAKKMAYFRHTSVSGLVEDLLLSAHSDKDLKTPGFVKKWAGAFHLARDREQELRFQRLKKKYGL